MGPDNIHPHMLNSLADTISKPLAIIFNKSMVSGTTPEQWAEAIITAIHKKGVRNIVGNYRPISLTSVISKVIELFVRDHIVQHDGEPSCCKGTARICTNEKETASHSYLRVSKLGVKS